jgi:hypothetical protein
MMKEVYVITHNTIIRNNQVWLNGNLMFEGREELSAFFTSVYRHFEVTYAKFFKMDNLCKLGLLASEVLLRNASLTRLYHGDEVGIVLSNAASSIDTDRNHQQSIADRDAYFPSPSVFVYTLANIVIGEICIRHKLHGESTFFVEKDFNPNRLYTCVKQLLDDHVVRCCITGWVEMDGDDYEAALYFIEKQAGHTTGIAIFEPEKLLDLYQKRS